MEASIWSAGDMNIIAVACVVVVGQRMAYDMPKLEPYWWSYIYDLLLLLQHVSTIKYKHSNQGFMIVNATIIFYLLHGFKQFSSFQACS